MIPAKRKKMPGCAQMRLLPRLADRTRTIALARASSLRDLAEELGLGEYHEPTRQRMGGRYLRPDEHAALLAEWDRREPERHERHLESTRRSHRLHAAEHRHAAIVHRPYADHLARATETWRLMCLDPLESRSPREAWCYLLAASTVLRPDEPMPKEAPERLGRAVAVELYGGAREVESDSETDAEREARQLKKRRKGARG